MEQEMERLIAACEARYEEKREDSFYSNVYYAELKELRRLARCLREEGAGQLLERLREEQPGLEAALEKELDHPTFDWYDEHYHAKVLEGVLDARRAVMAALEQE